MNALASGFLTETLIWTGALIAAVLVARRPVAQLLGAKAAYALWALPMLRLLLPPIELPAWMAPAPVAASEVLIASEAAMLAVDAVALPPAPATAAIDWPALLLALWLAGAAVFLIRRYALYFKMRRELLDPARPVGEAGRVRFVETPAAEGPVAFGVIDKVVALPVGFMAMHDRAARDLALAHELAHHRGHDLLCNMLVQPLFAVHWFNPLSALGWRALRRDQEAACDARVVARAPRESRAAYAAVIARFAIQPQSAHRLALAAPMACPVLGDRSIVQRLRSLAMTDVSARRRWLGRVLIAAAVMAVPLTGSISYAQSEAPPAPAAPAAPPVGAAAPLLPEAPRPPVAVDIGKDGKHRIVRIERRIDGEGGRDSKNRVERRIILRGEGEELSAGELAEIEAKISKRHRAQDHRVEHRVIRRDGREMSAAERAEFEEDMAEMHEDLAELRRELGEDGKLGREIRIAVAEAHTGARVAIRAAPRVRVECRDGQRQVSETVISDGRETIFVCSAAAMTEVSRAMAAARAGIARSHELSAAERAEALRSLDEAARETRAD